MSEDINNIADKETYIDTKENLETKIYTPKEQDEEYQIQMEGIPMPITFGKYGLFLHLSSKECNKKRGYNIAWDAYQVYQHLIYTGIMQKTNSVWANNTYIANGLNITSDRVRQAKKLLKEIELIEYQKDQKKEKNEKGLFTKQYIKVITVTPLSHSRLNPLTAQTPTNALGNKENALGNKRKEEGKDKSLPFPNKKDDNITNINIDNNEASESKERKEKIVTAPEDIDRIKNAYPKKTRGKNRERYTKTSVFDREKLKRLIKKHGADYIVEVINLYVKSQDGMYLQNFKTFINQFPSKEDFEEETVKETLNRIEEAKYKEMKIDMTNGFMEEVG